MIAWGQPHLLRADAVGSDALLLLMSLYDGLGADIVSYFPPCP